MAGQYDGSVRIKAEIEVQRAVKNLENLKNKLARQNEAIEKQRIIVSRLKEQYDRLTSGQEQPKSFLAMEKELQKVSAEAAKLDQQLQSLTTDAAKEKYIYGAVSPQTQAEIDNVAQSLAEADARADRLKADMEAIRLDPTVSQDARHLAQDIGAASSTLSRMENEAQDTGVKIKDAVEKANASIRRLEQYTENASAKMHGAAKSARSYDRIGKSVGRVAVRFRRLIASALLFSAVTKVFTGLREYMGNALRTSDEFSTALGRLKGALATAFQPIYDAIVPALTSFINGLATAISHLASFISMLFGTTVSASAKAAESLYNQANAYGAAGGAAEEAQKQLTGFDEINKLSDTSGGGGGGGGGGGVEAIFDQGEGAETPAWMQGIIDWFDEIKSRIDTEKIEDLKEAWDNFKTALKNFINSEGAKRVIVWLINLGLSLSTELLDALTGLVEIFDGLINMDWPTLDAGLGKLIGAFMSMFNFPINEWLDNLFGTTVFTDRIQKIVSTIKEHGLFKGMFVGIKTDWEETVAWWSNTAIVAWWQENVSPWFTGEKWGNLFNTATTGLKNAWQGFKTWWSTAIVSWWNNSIKPWFTKEKWETMLAGMKTALTNVFKTAMNGAITAVENGVNRVITAINWLIAKINQVLALSSLVGLPALQLPLIDPVSLPRLAQGTVVNPGHEFAAILGDNQREQEIVSPLSTMKQAFKEALAEAGGGGGAAILEVDGRRLGRVVYPYIQQEGGRIGTKLVTGGV